MKDYADNGDTTNVESKEDTQGLRDSVRSMTKSNLVNKGYGSVKTPNDKSSTCIGSYRGQTQKQESEENMQASQKFKIYSNEQLSESLSSKLHQNPLKNKVLRPQTANITPGYNKMSR